MGGKRQDLTGKVFTRLRVKCKTEKPVSRKNNGTYWLCECTCGSGKDVVANTSDLNSGHVRSCGCLSAEASSKRLIEINSANKGRGKKSKITKFYISDDDQYAYAYTSNTNSMFYIDCDDITLCNMYTWYENDSGYVVSRINGSIVRLHRMLVECNNGEEVDHINHNKKDNRRCNLRVVNRSQNNMNKNSKGVCFAKSKQKYMAYIGYASKRHFLGYFDTEEEAIRARKKAEDEIFQEYSYDNSIKNSDVIA